VSRTPLVVANWKMHLTDIWASALLDELLPLIAELHGVELAIAPSFPSLRLVGGRLSGSPVALAAQNCHWEDRGPYTGEVSARMLAELGVRYVIVGHSERRAHFFETDERVGRKVCAAARHGIVPILCVGEQERARDEGRTLAVVERQLRHGLGGVDLRRGVEVAIAYEPVWAIGTGRHATAEQVDEVHRMIREELAAMFGAEAAARTRILYGGSVSPDNASELLGRPEVDGALVGGASLEAASFAAIARQAAALAEHPRG
jgi:triosephosphate isomerase